MHGARRRLRLAASVAERGRVEPGEQRVARSREDRREREVQLVDEARASGTAGSSRRRRRGARPAAGRLPGAPERGVDAVGDEVKRRAALHRDRRRAVMRQHEHRHVVRRVRPPPALPAVVGPRPADGPNMLRPRIQAPTLRCRAPRSRRRTPVLPSLPPEHRGNVRVRKHPLVQAAMPPTPSGFSRSWSGTGAVAVNRNGERADRAST